LTAGRPDDREGIRVGPSIHRLWPWARFVRAAFALAVVTAPAAAAAQDTTVVRLDSLRITVTRSTAALDRLPLSAASLGAAAIRDGQATAGLDESLDRVPGVFINNRYNFSLGSRISIRGLGARAAFGVRGVRVLSDGIPLTMPDGQSNLNNLELGTADRIEVLRGPSSALYGNAAGGVISIETERPPPEFSTEVRATGGDAGRGGLRFDPFFKLQAKVGGPVGAGGWVASLSRLETDGYRDFSRAKQTVVNAVSRHPLGNGRLGLVLNVFDGPVAESAGALPRDSVDKDPTLAWPNNVRNGAGEATRQIQAGVSYARPLGENDRLDVAVYGVSRTVDNALPFAWIDLSRRGGGLRASWAGERGDGWLSLSAGVDVEFMSDERQEYDNAGGTRGTDLARDQTDRVTNVGPFFQALVALAPRIDLLAGMRFDAVHFSTSDHRSADGDDSGSRTLSAGSPTVGLSWAAAGSTMVYGNVGTAFQTPTTTELINTPPEPGRPCCPGGFNVDLEPQRATSIEAGLRTVAGGFVLDLALYRMTVRNTILPFQVADAEGREFFRNAGESLHRGFELSAVRSFGRHSLRAAWTFNDFTFVDDGDEDTAYEGNDLPGIPDNHFFAAVQLAPVDELRLDLELDHSGEYWANDANTAANEAATVLDLRIHASINVGSTAFRPFIAVQNLTSAHYNSSVVVNGFGGRYYEPAPPRNLIIGFALGTGAWRTR
jgi:iron complex outermembrane receptor protein